MFTANKYRNKKTIIDGIKFDSKKEGRYYLFLKSLELKGDIKSLKCQVSFDFPFNGKVLRYVDSNRAIKYVADFEYFDVDGNRKIVDVKGMKTKPYLIKRALMLAVHGILVEEA